MRMWFRPVKGIAFCIVAAFFGSQAMAQVQVKRSFPSAKRISAFTIQRFVQLSCRMVLCLRFAISLLSI